MRALSVAVGAICCLAACSRKPSDDGTSGEAAWRRVEELAAPLTKPGPLESLDQARQVASSHGWANDKSYPDMEGAIILLRQWQADEGGIRPTRGVKYAVNAVEYRNLLRPIVRTTTDATVLAIVETVGKRFLEQGTSLVDATIGVMVLREVALRARILKLPHTVDTALWNRAHVRMIAAEAVAIQQMRSDPSRPKPSQDSALDADASLMALTNALAGATLDDDADTLLGRLRAQAPSRAAAKKLLDDIIEQIEEDKKLAAELATPAR
ncbi:MAG: hypothetical protein KF773_18595 [Deltaproteobacteria bacterium]|nr:hypothetical protein [Deltaproteobacteria bacterium]